MIFIAVPNPAEQEALAHYGQESQRLADEAGAVQLVRYGVKEQIHGDEPAAIIGVAEFPSEQAAKGSNYAAGHPSIAAKKIIDENNVPIQQVNGTGKDGRITKQDVVAAMAAGFSANAAQGWGGTRDTEKTKMKM